MNDNDFLPDEALAKIEANVPKMAQDFDIEVSNAWAKSAQVMFRWDKPGDVFARGESIYALVEGAMCVDTLCKNLRAAREQLPWTLEETLGTVAPPGAQPMLDTIEVPRSFVEEVLQLQSGTGSEMGDRYERLYQQAEELLG